MFKNFLSSLLMIALISITSGGLGLMSPKVASAAVLTAVSDTVSNLTASTVANHTIQFTTPTGVASGATMILTFDNSTSVHASMTFADIDLRYNSTDVTLAAAPSGAIVGVVRTSATVLTFTNGTTVIPASAIIIIKIGTNASIGGNGVNQMTNGIVGTTTLRITGTFGDNGIVGMAIITNGVVAVTAEVLGSITFTIDQNAINFGTLSSAGPRYANSTTGSATPVTAFNIQTGTNGSTGYTLSVQGDTLRSGANTITAIPASAVSSTGSEQFGINLVKSLGGSGTIAADYGTASQYAYKGTTALADTIASATSATAVNNYAITYLANISAVTEAGSYTTAHTYVATGNF